MNRGTKATSSYYHWIDRIGSSSPINGIKGSQKSRAAPDLFGHNWIHRCESLSSQSTSTISRAIKWLSEQRNESDKHLLSLDRPDRQQQPDQWNQWFTEKQSRTRAFVKKNNGVLTINVACMVQTANEVVCS